METSEMGGSHVAPGLAAVNLLFLAIGIAVLVLGGLGYLAAGVSKVDLGNGIKFTVPAWLGGGALFLALAILMP